MPKFVATPSDVQDPGQEMVVEDALAVEPPEQPSQDGTEVSDSGAPPDTESDDALVSELLDELDDDTAAAPDSAPPAEPAQPEPEEQADASAAANAPAADEEKPEAPAADDSERERLLDELLSQ